MVRIYAVVEGRSEEAFLTNLLAPILWLNGIFITPILLRRTGGDPRWARVKGDVIKLLKQHEGSFVTTMFDLYGLGDDWPGRPASPITNGIEAANTIEAASVRSIQNDLGDELRVAARFFPHIQPFEFEGLLFSDTQSLASSLSVSGHVAGRLAAVRAKFATPEHINDSPQTAPSHRIKELVHHYDKVLYATTAARAVGVSAMRSECAHFRGWLEKLEASAQKL